MKLPFRECSGKTETPPRKVPSSQPGPGAVSPQNPRRDRRADWGPGDDPNPDQAAGGHCPACVSQPARHTTALPAHLRCHPTQPTQRVPTPVPLPGSARNERACVLKAEPGPWTSTRTMWPEPYPWSHHLWSWGPTKLDGPPPSNTLSQPLSPGQTLAHPHTALPDRRG